MCDDASGVDAVELDGGLGQRSDDHENDVDLQPSSDNCVSVRD